MNKKRLRELAGLEQSLNEREFDEFDKEADRAIKSMNKTDAAVDKATKIYAKAWGEGIARGWVSDWNGAAFQDFSSPEAFIRDQTKTLSRSPVLDDVISDIVDATKPEALKAWKSISKQFKLRPAK